MPAKPQEKENLIPAASRAPAKAAPQWIEPSSDANSDGNGEQSAFSRWTWAKTSQREALAPAVEAKARPIRVDRCESVSNNLSAFLCLCGELFLVVASPLQEIREIRGMLLGLAE